MARRGEKKARSAYGNGQEVWPVAADWENRLAETDGAAWDGTDRVARLLDLGDRLTERLQTAIGQLDRQLVKEKSKTHTVEYGNADAKGKPTAETVCERESMEAVGDMPIDCQGLNQLTGVLKNLYAVMRAERDSMGPSGQTVEFEGATKDAAV